MLFPLKKLLTILFLSSFLTINVSFAENNNVSLLLLDKSSSTKYEINFSNTINFRDLTFEIIACETIEFDKYIDQIALIRIDQKNKNFIGWFFKYTDEMNLYSNKIYEISLQNCST